MKTLLAACLILTAIFASAVAQSAKPRTGLTRSEIKETEQRLSNLGYWTGPADGVFDVSSRSALIAFQKWNDREVTGQLSIADLGALRASAAPRARELGYEHVEVDLDRQVLMLVGEDGSVRVLPVSTGNNQTFIDEGQESIAYTPRGRFLVYYKERGWKSGSLGSTFYANFISGGVAIHGSRSVPERPASHGCIRIPMFSAREVSRILKLGTIVLVYDKVSFVSALDWVKNPKLKEAAIANIAADDDYLLESPASKLKPIQIRKPRPRLVRS
jgi:peptidoglycan hydrolase-like protein with peptidoglycan-binding domain